MFAIRRLASLALAAALTACAGPVPVAPAVGSGPHVESPHYELQARKAKPTPTPTPIPGGFVDDLDALDGARWALADGWTNGDPFDCGWKADHGGVGGGALTLRLDDQASSGKPYTSAELRSTKAVGHGRVEGRLRAAKGSGLVTSLITYTGPSEGTVHDEIDVEILGQDPTRAQLNYFVAGAGGHEVSVPLGFDASAGFHDYAFDWRPDGITWYVDGRAVHAVATGPLPTTPGKIMANLWPGVNVDGWLGPFQYLGVPITAAYDRLSYQPR